MKETKEYNDIRKKAYNEMWDFFDWVATKHSDQYILLLGEYALYKKDIHQSKTR